MNNQIKWFLKHSDGQTMTAGSHPLSSLEESVIHVCEVAHISERLAVKECLIIELFSEIHSQRLGTYHFESGEFYPSSWYDDHPTAW